MKKSISLFLVFLIVFSLSSCGEEKTCSHSYETEVVSEATYYTEGQTIKTCIFCKDVITETSPKLEIPIEVSVTAMETFEQKRDPLIMPDGMEIFQPSLYWIILEIDVKNLSEKDISGFSGTFTIDDNDRQLKVSGNFDEAVSAGATIHLSEYGFQVSQTDMTMADDMLMGKTIDDIKIEFALNEVK